jgi:single-stranded-DNA-specific exonuclease
MGQEGKHARFNLHSGAHRALGVAFGRSQLGVGAEDTVDAAVRLEVNHWNGAVEPRVVLRELYPHEDAGAAEAEESAWWDRFEAELAADPAAWPPERSERPGRRTACPVSGSAAATLAELASSGAGVLGLVADLPRRAALGHTGARLAEYGELERDPSLAAEVEHVVLVDPPPFPHLERLVSETGAGGGGYLHPAWGEPELRFAIAALGDQLARRGILAGVFRDLRESSEEEGRGLYEALRGSGPHPRGPEAAARCFAVLAELGLVQGAADRGRGAVGVVSSEGTDLERSAAYRAYSARYQEGLRYLEGRKQT